ncbi:unnamed protein product [Mesocestoides corti]|uniref:Uncharacterized protein n=1 Tax=Mesocestoides corti TaxID=53468 RepID=A0A3P6HKL5_MESCO|nr:unnamed protein product [Mesocestoides corti]
MEADGAQYIEDQLPTFVDVLLRLVERFQDIWEQTMEFPT